MESVTIRPISDKDNFYLAKIIRNALKEFGADKPGTVYYDAATDALYELFQKQGAFYFVAEAGAVLLGGAGIFPTDGLPADTCELVKMYLAPEARRKGIGKMLIDECLRQARSEGFNYIYLETMPELSKAISLYEQKGFEYLDGPLGTSGHFGCGIWMKKKLAFI